MLLLRPQALVLDFDGVLTDNRVFVSEDGMESVICHRGDSYGLRLIKDLGLDVAVISLEENPVVKVRCDKLNLPCYWGVTDKKAALMEFVQSRGLRLEDTIFVGNDLNDIDCIQIAGCGVAVGDAVPQVKEVSDIVLRKNGGQGAVREICDLIIIRLEQAR